MSLITSSAHCAQEEAELTLIGRVFATHRLGMLLDQRLRLVQCAANCFVHSGCAAAKHRLSSVTRAVARALPRIERGLLLYCCALRHWRNDAPAHGGAGAVRLLCSPPPLPSLFFIYKTVPSPAVPFIRWRGRR